MGLGNIWVPHRKLLYTILVIAAGVLLSVGIYFFNLSIQPKQVTLIVDGQSEVIMTKAKTVEQLLQEKELSIIDKDVVRPDLTAAVDENMTVELLKSWQIPVVIAGKKQHVQTTNRDVAGVLQDAGIKTDGNDKVTPALDSKLTKDTEISVISVEEKVVQENKEVVFREVRKNDPSLKKGEIRELKKGQAGSAVLHYKVTTEDGKETSRELVKTEVVKEKQDRVLAVGTKKQEVVAATLASRGGKDIRAKRVLTNVELSAYTANAGGGYGKTATGVKATVGRTVAVDPKVVPLGWWVYIEGIGYRRAEDTGGAIKGNKMDVFLESDSEAVKFGRKKGRTVHVIGPKLP
ncbi:3D domain-containing protein [Brevibacillus daliensis]|uniref:3D domain-containing protein n=1 Tax=Brevibacillus daliensis TaxID=2892995 RepID=UPI001E5E5E32|nr:3D domain-containing protein [Brevibacillus daliensis]